MTGAVTDLTLAELEDQRDFLLASLEDLESERDAGDIDEDDYLVLRDSYTARAAAVLRSIEGRQHTGGDAGDSSAMGAVEETAGATPGGARAGAEGRRRGRLRPALTAAAVLALAAVAGTLVAHSAGERLPGDPSSGSITSTGASADLQRARDYVGTGKTLEAIRAYDRVLVGEPNNPEALAYRGWLLRLAGRAAGNKELVERGLAYLDRAVAADPTYPDAHFFRGATLYQDRGDPAGAVAEFRAFLANDPPSAMVPVVEDALRRALADAAAAGATPAPVTPSPAAGSPAAPAASSGGSTGGPNAPSAK